VQPGLRRQKIFELGALNFGKALKKKEIKFDGKAESEAWRMRLEECTGIGSGSSGNGDGSGVRLPRTYQFAATVGKRDRK
jgi:hypothetical protein